jgi:hypothetical protein
MEVDFFVIVENSKGKMSDRAVHLQVHSYIYLYTCIMLNVCIYIYIYVYL